MRVLRTIMLSTVVMLAAVIFAGCAKDDLGIVKKGHLDIDKTITVGKALDGYKYFDKKEWQAVKTPQGARVVVFKADMNQQYLKELNDACGKTDAQRKPAESQKWSIQFTINKDNTFFITGTQTLTIATDKSETVGSLSEPLVQSVFKNELAPVCK